MYYLFLWSVRVDEGPYILTVLFWNRTKVLQYEYKYYMYYTEYLYMPVLTGTVLRNIHDVVICKLSLIVVSHYNRFNITKKYVNNII